MIIIIPSFFIYFLCGVVFVEALPLLETIFTLIAQFFTMLQGYLAIVVAKQSAKIAKIKEEAYEEDTPIRAIGFDVSYQDDADTESEED